MENNLALVAASKSGDVAQVAHLLSQDTQVDYKEIGEDTSPLGHAALAGHFEVCKLLLEAGANVLDIDDCYFTPLHYAMSKNHEEIVQLLLQPSSFAISDGTTILHWMAAAEASVDQLQRVLDAGCDPTIKDDEDRLAWAWAAEAADDNDCDNAVLLREAAQKLTAANSIGGHNKTP